MKHKAASYEDILERMRDTKRQLDELAAALEVSNGVIHKFGGWLDWWSIPRFARKFPEVYEAWDQAREGWDEKLNPAAILAARLADEREPLEARIAELENEGGLFYKLLKAQADLAAARAEGRKAGLEEAARSFESGSRHGLVLENDAVARELYTLAQEGGAK